MSVVLNLAEWLDSNFRRNFDNGELLFTGSFVGNKLRYIWEVTSCRGVFGQHCSYTRRRVFNWFFFFLFLLFFGWMIRHLLTIPTILCKEAFYFSMASADYIITTHYALFIGCCRRLLEVSTSDNSRAATRHVAIAIFANHRLKKHFLCSVAKLYQIDMCHFF